MREVIMDRDKGVRVNVVENKEELCKGVVGIRREEFIEDFRNKVMVYRRSLIIKRDEQ